ncbi:YadA-like family protein [Phocoenobacter skyensis]|uniref:Autotransporter adhesin n=1 Tax=Phocoenobacter skyensis TaxID=97481 RepID=A0A1H7U3S7_9PAST|nr:YadA-like family protein [Pasteurella skyensis]SEL91474.1 Autotransporter adhesin [Pasteurella skyensis]
MNNIYKVVFNKATQTFTAVSELAKSKTKTHSSTTNKPQVQAGRSSFKFAKMTLSVLIALGLSTSSIATTLTPEELKQQIDDLKAQVEKLEKQKNYFHVNSANYNQSGTDDNADVINGIGGAKGAYSVTAGVDAQAISQDSVALGHNAKAADTYAVAIGHGAQALGHRSIAIGDDAITGVGLQSTAVGHGARATGLESTAFGNYSHALGEQALAIGNDVFAGGIYSIAMGTRWIGSNDPEGHEGGEGERTTTDGNFAIAIGSGYDRNSQNQIAESDGDYGIALGTSARTEKAGVAGVAIGRFSSVDKLGGVAIGSRSAAHRAAMSTASLGVDANATVDTNKVYASKGISDIDKEAILSTVKGELGAVSVGSQDRTFKLRDKFDQDGNVIEEGKTFTIKGATRQIINVAAGSEDSDAVNVAQLKAAFNAVGTAKNYFHVNKTENTQTGNESNEAFVDGIGGAKGGLAIAGGVNAQATGDSSVAFGYDADAIGSNAIAIGREAYAYGTHSSTTEVDGTVALGHKAQAKVGGNVAIGTEAVAEELRSTAIGYGTRATGQMSTALGQNAHATSTESLALGSFTHATGAQTIAVGNDLFAEGTQSIVIGTRHIGSSSPDNGLNGEGKDTATNGAFAIAIGSGAGRGSDVQLAESDADYGIALGTSSRTEARARAGVAIGLLSSAESSGGVALGRDSIANRNAISGKKTSTEAQASAGAVYANEAATGDDKSDILKTVQGRLGAVSVGTGDREFAERDYKEGEETKAGEKHAISKGTRQIINVAAGSEDSDAVNVAQLKAVAHTAEKHTEVKNGTNVADVVKTTGTDGHDIYTVNVEGTKVAGSTDVVVSSTADAATNDTTYNVDLSAGIKAEIANKSVEKVAAGTGIKVTSTADDDKTYTVELDQTAKTQLAKEESVVSTNNNVAITHATTNSTGGLEYALTLASNLTGITSIGNAPNGGKIILGETDKNISVNGGKLTNVKQGTENTDAVNVKQLKDYVTSTAKPTAVTVNEGTEANSNDYNTTGNLQIKETTANGGKPTYDIKLADKVTLGTADNQIVIDGTTGNITAGGVAIDGAANTVKGLSNTTFDPNATYTGGQAATQEQLKVVSDVAADKSIEEVVGTNGIAVTSSTGETDKTYTVGLDTATQTKVDNALQSIKTEINGQTVVQTLDKDNNIAKFNEGKNIVLTNNNGSIQVATANDLKGLTSVVLGNALGNDTVSLTTGGINAGQKVITNVATGVNGTDAVNVAQLTDTVNKSKVEVKNGTNVADVVKTTGTDGHDIYTVNVEGTKVAGSTDVVVSSTADVATNDTTYNVDLSAGIKAEIANKSVEKVAAGTGIKVTSTADDDKTYTVELDQTAKTQLAKEESVVSTNNNVAITHATTNSTGGLEYALTLASNLTGITSIGNAPNGGKIILGETDKNISVNGGKLTNVKQGTENTDAVNVKQLKDYVTSTAKPTAVTVNEGTEANSNAYNTTGNLQIKETTANGGKPTYDIKLADKVTLGTADNQIVIDGTAGNVTAGGVAIDGTAKTVKGLSNTTFDPNATYTGGQAATQEQLKAVSDVAADKSIEKVVGTNGIAVTSSTGETDKTYTVGLDTTTKNSIDSALQSIVTQIDGAEVKTLTKDNNNANFLTGKNIVLTNEGGGIKVATADNLKGLTSVILGDVAGDTVVSLTQNGINAGQKVIRNVATGVNGTDAVNVNQLESVVNTAATKAKTEVAGGTNVAGVVKTTGTDGHDIYTVNVEGTKVAGSTDVVVSSTTDATTNDTTYTVRLSDDFKTKAKDQSVEKVVAGTGIKVTSTAGDDKTYTVELDDLVKTQLAKEESVVAADTNVVISQTKTNRTGGKEFEIKLADTVTLGTGDNQVVIDGTKGKVTAGLVTVNGKEGTINGLTNKTFDKDNFVSGQAATEDQLSAVAKSLTTDIANKGLNFKGNEGSVHRALGTALTIEGEKGADATQHLNENSKTAADNLYVKAEGDKLEIKLSEDVKNLNSVVLGTDASDKDTVALTKDGINAGSKKVTHVADGTIANDSTDAVNGSQLFDVADSVKNNFGGNANVADDGTLTFTDIGGTGEDTIHDAIASLKKVTDLGVSIVTQIDGKDVKTLSKADNKANFVAGKNIALTAEKGAIKVSTKDDLEVNSIANVKGTKLSLGEGAITLATKKSNANPTGAVQIKNVAAGIADTDAVNVAQLKGVTKAIDNVASEMEDIKGGVSSAMAAALLPQAYLPGQSVVSLAGATYKKNTAVAVGLSTISDNGKWIIKGSLNTNSTGEVGGGIGAGYAW